MTVSNRNRFDQLISRHNLAASIIAFGLLTSASIISAAAINYSGQLAKDSYTSLIAIEAPSQKTGQTEAEVASAHTEAGDTGTTPANASSTGTPTVPTANITVKTNTATPAAPTVASVNTTPATPATETTTGGQGAGDQTSETPANTPAFSIVVTELPQLGARQASYRDQLMHINIAGIELSYDEGYQTDGKQLTTTAVAVGSGFFCEINGDKADDQLHVAIPESSATGDYTCRITVSDGTVSQSADYTVHHEALPNDSPQPAAGYEFMFNVQPLETVGGINVYTSKYNYPASPFCQQAGPYYCESTASIAFDVRVSEGATAPQANETVTNTDYPGLSCTVFATPSYANNGYGTVTLKARQGVAADGIYTCEFSLVDGQTIGSGILVAELANGVFRSVSSDQLGGL